MSVAPHMVKNLPYDPKRDIAPITMGVDVSERDRRACGRAGEDARGVRRAGEAEARRADLCVVRAGRRRTSRRRALQAARRHRSRPRSLQGRRAGDDRPARRRASTCTRRCRRPLRRTSRPASCARSRRPARSARRRCPTCRRSRSRATPGSRRPTGTRSSRPARRRRRSSTSGIASSSKVLNDPQVNAELAKHGLDPAPGTRDELARYMDAREREMGQGRARGEDHGGVTGRGTTTKRRLPLFSPPRPDSRGRSACRRACRTRWCSGP